MKYGLYSVRDKLAGKIAPPFMAVNEMVALRQFRGLQFPQGIPPEDMELVKITDIEDEGDYKVVATGQSEEKGGKV